MDEIDRGQEREQLDRERALAETRARIDAANAEAPAPAEERECLGCLDPIDPRRLHAHPGAVRCIECQYIWEHYGV
jgi:phage/conjugal plasmid C-4 type zinc finger TraR family protein